MNQFNNLAAKAKKANHFAAVKAKFNVLFKRMAKIDPSAEGKRMCLKMAVQDMDGYSESEFMKEVAKYVKVLLDSREYGIQCKARGYNPFAAATHIVVMSKIKDITDLIMNHNYSNPCFEGYNEWGIPIYSENELRPWLKGYLKEPKALPQPSNQA